MHVRGPLLLCAVLGGCAANGGSDGGDGYLALHRERLRRLVAAADRDWDEALARGRSSLPAESGDAPVDGPAVARSAAPQERVPRHIDDVLPPRPRQEAHAARLGAGLGRLEIAADGTRFKDTVDLLVLRADLEPMPGASGVGVRLELSRSDDGLFAGETMNDGRSVQPARARAGGLDFFPHHVWQLGHGGDLELPLRAGVFTDLFAIDHSEADVERRWWSLGARAQFEPSWRMTNGEGAQLSLTGLLGADLGAARFSEHYVLGSDTETGLRWMGEAGLGLRLADQRWFAELGYRLRNVEFDSSGALFGADRTRATSQVLFLDFGLRF